jgi:hypothetical protein
MGGMVQVASPTVPASWPPEKVADLQNAVRAVCKKNRGWLRLNRIERDEAVQELCLIIVAAAGKWDPDKGASWYSYCYGIAAKRIIDLGRRQQTAGRWLAPERKAAAWEAEEMAIEDPETAELLRGMTTLQLVRYLMAAGRKLPRLPGDNSAYSPCTRSVIAFLAGKLKMGYGALCSFLRDNQEIAQACECWPVPKPRTVQHWLEDTASARVHQVVKITI